jgi:lipid II:glycine glycyltransferase (peptidoglycan interpeptide bridge formation enzyme)
MHPALSGSGLSVGQIATMRLSGETETLWHEVVRYSVRKAVKQAQSHGVTVTFETNHAALQRDFFPLYLSSMKRLGVPPHRFAYYALSMSVFGKSMLLAIAHDVRGKPVAGLLGFSCGQRVSIINTVSDPTHWHLRANDLLHWNMICHSAESGHRIFDFGSVRYEGQSTYKKKWGAQFVEHKNYLLSAKERGRPETVIDSSSGGMRRMSQLWSAYVPDAIKPHLGPMIRRQLAR